MPEPVWSPDGSDIAFFSGFNLYAIHPDGSDQTGIVEVDDLGSPPWGLGAVDWTL
jgi:Tol biopolymer transport system component